MVYRAQMKSAIAVVLCAVLTMVPLTALAAEGDEAGQAVQGPPLVREIVVEGNVEIDSKTILEQVQATQIGDVLDPDKVQEDVNHIADLGYFEDVEAQPLPFRDGAKVVFKVKEFPVVRDVQITVKDDLVSPAEVRSLLSVEEGRILNAKTFGDEMDRLPVQSGEELGYVLRPTKVEFGGDNGDVLRLDLTPVRIGEILVEGNEKTKEIVVRRELTFESGDILSMQAVRNSLRKLGQMGYFEPIVPDFLSTQDPLVVDVLLPVTEVKTGRAAFGAGYSSADGLVGYIEVADNNFLGRGEEVNVKWEFGKRKNTYDLGFTEPYLFGTDTSAGINLYNRLNRRQQFIDDTAHPYTTKRIGGDLTFGRPLGEFTRGFLTLKMEDASVTPGEASGPIGASENRTRSLIFNTRTDTTDHLFFPTLGFRHNFSVEAAGHFLGGDTRFTKYQTSFSKFIKAGSNNQTWAFRVITGLGVGPLPLQEEFQVGGPETVRGYRYGEMRGDRMLVMQGEYRFPISENVNGVVFVDAGNAWLDEPIDVGELRKSVGVGVRFNTPLGVMRIDYGVGDQGGNASFSLGPSF